MSYPATAVEHSVLEDHGLRLHQVEEHQQELLLQVANIGSDLKHLGQKTDELSVVIGGGLQRLESRVGDLANSTVNVIGKVRGIETQDLQRKRQQKRVLGIVGAGAAAAGGVLIEHVPAIVSWLYHVFH